MSLFYFTLHPVLGEKRGRNGARAFYSVAETPFPRICGKSSGEVPWSTTASFTEGSKEPRAADHSAVFNLKLGCKSWGFGRLKIVATFGRFGLEFSKKEP